MALYKHQLECALRDSEHKFRSIFTYSSDGITLIDHTGAIIEWNESAEHITGLTREEVLTRPLWDVLFQLTPPKAARPTHMSGPKVYTFVFSAKAARHGWGSYTRPKSSARMECAGPFKAELSRLGPNRV